MRLVMEHMRKIIVKIKYWTHIIFLALADISMCECAHGKELKTYCNIK